MKWKLSRNACKWFIFTDLINWNIKISEKCRIHEWFKQLAQWKIEIWDYTYLAWNNYLTPSEEYPIKIWKFCSIADGVCFIAWSYHDYTIFTTSPYPVEKYQYWWAINIWNDVRIWRNAIILKWVTIWTWAVVWAWAIVTKDIPPYAIVWWNPAKIIKYRFEEKTIKKLLKSERWNQDIEKIKKSEFQNI